MRSYYSSLQQSGSLGGHSGRMSDVRHDLSTSAVSVALCHILHPYADCFHLSQAWKLDCDVSALFFAVYFQRFLSDVLIHTFTMRLQKVDEKKHLVCLFSPSDCSVDVQTSFTGVFAPPDRTHKWEKNNGSSKTNSPFAILHRWCWSDTHRYAFTMIRYIKDSSPTPKKYWQ